MPNASKQNNSDRLETINLWAETIESDTTLTMAARGNEQ